MKKLYNNRFIFIVCISVIFMMVLTFGTISLTKRNNVAFEGDGYIISNNKVIDFKSGTTYRLNLNENIVFEGEKETINEVPLDSFVHYLNKNISLLKNGAFVDLNSINEDIAPYYNITNKSLISYDNGGYKIKSGTEELSFDDILLRINDDKYLIGGKDIKVKVPGVPELVSGQYFELTFVEEGIILIENDKDSYQVTAEDTKVFIKDKTVIDLNTKNILYDGVNRLNMSQVTIDGNENIEIKPEEEKEESKNEPGDIVESTEKEESKQESTEESGSGNGNSSEDEKIPEKKDVSIELVKFMLGVKDLTAIFQVNNPLQIKGELQIKITDIDKDKEITPSFNLTKTGYLSVYTDKLESNSSYMLSISEINGKKETEYIQRLFTTDNYGVNIEKIMITEDELKYKVVFKEQSRVDEVNIVLTDETGKIVENSERTIDRTNNELYYTGLKSNTLYKIKVVGFKINSTTYADSKGFIVKNTTTLKAKPTFKAVKVQATEEKEFILSLAGIEDKDNSITKYNFMIYKDPDLKNMITKLESTSPTITTGVGKDNLEPNKNYRYKVLIEYNDNEKDREIETNFSSRFISTGASIVFNQYEDKSGFNKIAGEIILHDPDCTVPMPGRACNDKDNKFSIHYNRAGKSLFKDITFEATDKKDFYKATDLVLTGLNPNTSYIMELYGTKIVEEDGTNVTYPKTIIGDPFIGKTLEAPNLRVEKEGDKLSTIDTPINFDMVLSSDTNDASFIDEVKTMTVTLYSLNTLNEKTMLKEKVLNGSEIKALYKNQTNITNKWFGIASLDELKEIASDGEWVYGDYLIEFTNAYGVEVDEVTDDTVGIPIENNQIYTSITKSFLIDYYSKEQEKLAATVKGLKNVDESGNKIKEGLNQSTLIGYRIDGTVYVEEILKRYCGTVKDGGSINWYYRFFIYDAKSEEPIYKSNDLKTTTHTFYLDDKNMPLFRRGNEYKFGFQIILSDSVYPDKPVIAIEENSEDKNDLFNPPKENPRFELGVLKSTKDSLTYSYKIAEDIDNALYENKLYIVTGSGSSRVVADEKEVTKSEQFQELTFNNLEAGKTYYLEFKKVHKNQDKEFINTSIGGIIFEGEQNLHSNYKLKYEEVGSQLSIIIENDELVKRADAYEVNITSGNKKLQLVIPKEDLYDCEGSTASSKNNCIAISYQSLENFIGLNSKIDVKAYYENGLIGIEQKSKYFVFKNAQGNYFTVSKTGNINNMSKYSNGLYTLDKTNDSIKIKNNIDNYAWNDKLPYSDEIKTKIINFGVSFGRYGSFQTKVIKEQALTTSDPSGNDFFFTSIVPTAKMKTTRKINTVDIEIEQTGLTKVLVENQFEMKNRKVYVDLFADETDANPITKSVELDVNDLTKKLNYKFDNLLPNHTYRVKIYAYILNKNKVEEKKELYDYNTSGLVEIRDKKVSTLSASEIFDKNDITFKSETKPDKYMNRYIKLVTTLKDIDNYALEIKVLDKELNEVFKAKNLETFEKEITTNYDISDDKFIFGNKDYKLVLTATTKDKGANKLVLCEQEFVPHLESNPDITELEDPTFALTNKKVYVPKGENKYAIEFGVGVNDRDLVIKNADYYVKVVEEFSGKSLTPVGHVIDSEGFVKLNQLKEINTALKYKGIDHDSHLIITVKADTYKNNASLSEKNNTVIYQTSMDTGSEYNLSLGEGTLSIKDKVITVNYNGASNLNNITKIYTTIYKNGKVIASPSYEGENIDFVYENESWKLNLDLTNYETDFTASDKITVNIRYRAKDLDGKEGPVGKATYTTAE